MPVLPVSLEVHNKHILDLRADHIALQHSEYPEFFFLPGKQYINIGKAWHL